MLSSTPTLISSVAQRVLRTLPHYYNKAVNILTSQLIVKTTFYAREATSAPTRSASFRCGCTTRIEADSYIKYLQVCHIELRCGSSTCVEASYKMGDLQVEVLRASSIMGYRSLLCGLIVACAASVVLADTFIKNANVSSVLSVAF